MRIALVEKWQYCTLPGCDRSAVKAELDHIEPFNHENPGRGGPTSMGNLHPLCREHHQMKTDNRLRVTRHPETGMLTWMLPGGHQLTARPPSNPIGQAHAEQLLNLTT
nr:HNH endonuclease signature motif containing protein [Brevibacterium luteolum]